MARPLSDSSHPRLRNALLEIRMARRSDIEILRDQLKSIPHQRATRLRLGRELGWDADKVDRVIERALIDRRNHIHLGRGGNVKYLGSELGSGATVGLYTDVERVISRWVQRQLGGREVEAFRTSKSGRRGAGQWTHPDLVFAAYPRRRKTRNDPKFLHAVEIETVQGFTIKSVYQAHAQARGADYAWVFTFSDAIDKSDKFDRISWAAQQLGVGIVQFDKSSASGTYQMLFEARQIESTVEDRLNFVTRVMNQPEHSPFISTKSPTPTRTDGPKHRVSAPERRLRPNELSV
jgi:hypothetical protein